MIEERTHLKVFALYLIAIFLVVLNLSNIKIAGVSSLIPLFDLMMVYYFSIFKREFPIWFIFLLGMWNDALNGNPLGTTSLCYIVLIKVLSLLNSKTIAVDDFKGVWRQFMFFSLAFVMMKWTILSIFEGTTYSLVTPVIQLVLSSLLYVIMHRFFDFLNEKLLES